MWVAVDARCAGIGGQAIGLGFADLDIKSSGGSTTVAQGTDQITLDAVDAAPADDFWFAVGAQTPPRLRKRRPRTPTRLAVGAGWCQPPSCRKRASASSRSANRASLERICVRMVRASFVFPFLARA